MTDKQPGTHPAPLSPGDGVASERRSRRAFLAESASGLAAFWVAADVTGILAAAEHVWAQTDTEGPSSYNFAFFTPEQAVEVDAVAAQIIPTDETPGAREAQVVRFIDRLLVTFERDRQSDYTQGLADLAARTKQQFPSADRFSDLTFDQQIELLTSIEDTPFFQLVRTHTITGFLAHPVHGGNHDKIGWKLIGFDDSLHHEPPFGYYDAIAETRR